MTALNNKEIFAKNLNRYIERSGKDRGELANIWGYPYSTVSDWVSAKKYPRIDRIQVMADYFGITMADLIEDKSADDTEQSAIDDGLNEEQRALIEAARSFPADKAALALRLLRSIVEAD